MTASSHSEPSLRKAEPIADVVQRSAINRDQHAIGVQHMFDDIAPTYDKLNRLLSFGIDRRWRTQAIKRLAQHRAPGPLLDLCAGTLDLAAELRAQLPQEESVIAVDLAHEMLRRGAHKLGGDSLIILADALALPLRSHHCGGVICGFGLRNLADLRAGVAEIHRVLAPGGVFVGLEFFQPESTGARLLHRGYANHLLPNIGRLVSGHDRAYRYLAESMEHFVKVSDFANLLLSEGFVDIRVRSMTMGVAHLVWATKSPDSQTTAGTGRTANSGEAGPSFGRMQWMHSLRCPACGSSLAMPETGDSTNLQCNGCERSYVIENGIFNMLASDDPGRGGPLP